MTLASGSKLGPYEVRSPLGAGGMGEVYRARDTRLGRDVALKVLPEAFAADTERMARFEREASAELAKLHHKRLRDNNRPITFGMVLSSQHGHVQAVGVITR